MTVRVLSDPMSFDPSSHERLTERRWDEPRVRAAIAAIAADTESAFDEGLLWPAHPQDEKVGRLPPLASLYLGASGVIWALHELERVGAAELRCDWAPERARIAVTKNAPDQNTITWAATIRQTSGSGWRRLLCVQCFAVCSTTEASARLATAPVVVSERSSVSV